MKRTGMIPLLVLFLGACAQITLVEPGARAFDGRYEVRSNVAWNEVKEGHVVVWTNDGFALQTIRFYAGLEEGDSLFVSKDETKPLPSFQADMRASEVSEFVVDSLESFGFQQVTATGLRPSRFGARQGFRFEMDLLTADGLELSAMAVAARDGEQLDLILYMGERHYYFPKYQEEVERLFDSITIRS